jgi:catechol 2,3-dioxygenase-like lactoylglutathione lyase family enzyme
MSFTVSNLERSVSFYHEMLGMSIVKIQERTGPDISGIVGYDNAILKIAFLELPNAGGILLELIEYVNPKGQVQDMANYNTGNGHICFAVDDIWTVYETLKAKGVHFKSAPVEIQTGIFKGSYAVYMMDPDGITLELAQYV